MLWFCEIVAMIEFRIVVDTTMPISILVMNCVTRFVERVCVNASPSRNRFIGEIGPVEAAFVDGTSPHPRDRCAAGERGV